MKVVLDEHLHESVRDVIFGEVVELIAEKKKG